MLLPDMVIGREAPAGAPVRVARQDEPQRLPRVGHADQYEHGLVGGGDEQPTCYGPITVSFRSLCLAPAVVLLSDSEVRQQPRPYYEDLAPHALHPDLWRERGDSPRSVVHRGEAE